MKKNTGQSRELNRISRQDHLPLLRGMFVHPKSTDKKQKSVPMTENRSFTSEEGLFLTAAQGCYLGE
jgi:hypothetical protein